MVRAAARLAAVSASAATIAICMAVAPVELNLSVARSGPPGVRATDAVDSEAWLICTSMGSMPDAADWADLDSEVAAGLKAIAARDWRGAIAALSPAALRDPRNADIQNYLGYAHRRLREFEPAFQHYRHALLLNPRHRSAHGHLGEAYLAIGKLAPAQEHLAALESICLIPCEEYDNLKGTIAAYQHWIAR